MSLNILIYIPVGVSMAAQGCLPTDNLGFERNKILDLGIVLM